MKLTAIFLLAGCLQLSAKGLTQGLTMSKRNAPLQEVFKDIEKQTGYQFFYKEKVLDGTKSVTINVKNATLEQVLQTCFKDQPVTYNIVDKIIVVTPKQATSPNDEANLRNEPPPPIDITGKVTDADGNPLSGATVKVKGTSKGTTTGNDGVFVLKGVDDNAVLEISFVGYETYTVAVANKTAIVASLKIKPENLNEVVINKGYYSTNRVNNVGNVTTVTSRDIEKQPIQNPLLALEGRVPGLFISQSSGVSGSGVKVIIQGQNSISKGNDPLYVVDGVPYPSQLLPNLGGVLGLSGNVYGNPLSYVNPSDIESISILKDADATSIYGSRAANGAILITTKKGKSGKTRVNINLQNGWGKVTRTLDLLNTQQYLQMRHEAKKNDNANISSSDYDVNGFWDTTRYTNWQKVLFGRSAIYTTANGTISGGNSNVQYLVGTSYHRETSVFLGDFADQKAATNVNLRASSENQKLKFELTGVYVFDLNKLPYDDITGIAINLPPDAPSLYNNDGSLNWAPNASGSSTWTNPLSRNYREYENKTNNLLSNSIISYQLFPFLELKSSFGYSRLESNEIMTSPFSSARPETRPFISNYAQFGTNHISSWIIEPQIGYRKLIHKSKLEGLVGTTFNENRSDGQQLLALGYSSDLVIKDIRSASSVTVNSTVQSVYKYNAFFGRFGYTYDDRYLINLTARRDGSSRFGDKNKFHNFSSIGAGWVFSKENFFRDNLHFISFGKLRGSFGTTGNDQIGDYQYLNLYGTIGGIDVPYQGAQGLQINGLPNPYLQWEETKKLQGGLEMGLFNDRISIDINYFRNRSSNQLLNYALPLATGFGSITSNFPATIQNTGWEFSISSLNLKSSRINWNSSFNITIPKNKLIEFKDLANSAYASTFIVGQPVSIQKMYKFLGVDPTTGKYQFADKDGKPTFTPDASADQTTIINSLPKFYGGFQNNIVYKGLELNFLFQFVQQLGKNFHFGTSPGRNLNQPTTVLSRWQKPGDLASIQRYNSTTSLSQQLNNARSSDRAWSDASYIRLKNLSLSWSLVDKWTQKLRLQDCKIYVQGQNLLTFTNFQGLDPENNGANLVLPPLKVLTLGIHLTL